MGYLGGSFMVYPECVLWGDLRRSLSGSRKGASETSLFYPKVPKYLRGGNLTGTRARNYKKSKNRENDSKKNHKTNRINKRNIKLQKTKA